MVAKNKNFNLRIDEKLKGDVFSFVKTHEKYDDASSLIREAIREKIYPDLRAAMFRENMNWMIENDPDIKRKVDKT